MRQQLPVGRPPLVESRPEPAATDRDVRRGWRFEVHGFEHVVELGPAVLGGRTRAVFLDGREVLRLPWLMGGRLRDFPFRVGVTGAVLETAVPVIGRQRGERVFGLTIAGRHLGPPMLIRGDPRRPALVGSSRLRRRGAVLDVVGSGVLGLLWGLLVPLVARSQSRLEAAFVLAGVAGLLMGVLGALALVLGVVRGQPTAVRESLIGVALGVGMVIGAGVATASGIDEEGPHWEVLIRVGVVGMGLAFLVPGLVLSFITVWSLARDVLRRRGKLLSGLGRLCFSVGLGGLGFAPLASASGLWGSRIDDAGPTVGTIALVAVGLMVVGSLVILVAPARGAPMGMPPDRSG